MTVSFDNWKHLYASSPKKSVFVAFWSGLVWIYRPN